MNSGLIAPRYAQALLTFSAEEKAQERVYRDAYALQDALQAKKVTDESLATCIEGLSDTMRKFIALVIHNKRVDYLPAILKYYRVLYRHEHGITQAWLTTADEQPGLVEKLTLLMKEQGFTKVDFKTEIDPGIIGGFVVQIEDKRLDASIASQLKKIRKELEERIRKTHKNG